TRVHQGKQQQDELHRIFPPVLELAEGIAGAGRRLHEQAGVARRMRHERDYWHKRQRWMKTAPVKSDPRQSAARDHIRPEALYVDPAKRERSTDRCRHEDEADSDSE